MSNLIAIINDIIVVFFDLIIYTRLTKLKKDTVFSQILMYSGCSVIMLAYIVSTYVYGVPSSVSSFLFMTLPSFILFWILSEYKGARFFVTFCFVDTVTIIIGFFSRSVGIFGGTATGIAGCILSFILFTVIYIKSRPYFSRYRALLDSVQDGWGTSMVATILIYFLLVFSAAFPKPLIERPEYLAVYSVQSITVLSFYVVFIMSLFQKKRLYDLNKQQKNEKKWHKIAYVDALTNLNNRMSYIERIDKMERVSAENKLIHAIMIDLDNFKQINDNLGHHIGDLTLQKAADFLRNIFPENGFEMYRIGGDEFAVIANGISKETIAEKISNIVNFNPDIGCAFSAGYSQVNPTENNAMENAFIRADRAIYEAKKTKKHLECH